MPAVLTPDDLNTIHGVDERISIDNLVLGIKITYETLIDLCSTQATERNTEAPSLPPAGEG